MIRYPKTPRIGDVPWTDQERWGRLTAVVSEKVDGANVGIRSVSGALQVQSRGHVLRGGPRERQFDILKSWAADQGRLASVLGSKYMLFGEWCFAKHRAFYDALPSYLVCLDVYDIDGGFFLAEGPRDSVVSGLGLHFAPVLHRGPFRKVSNLSQFVGPSLYKSSSWRKALAREAAAAGVTDPASGTDGSDLMEGVYLRVEDGSRVVGRAKLPRQGFEKVRSDDSGWLRRPIVRNLVKV